MEPGFVRKWAEGEFRTFDDMEGRFSVVEWECENGAERGERELELLGGL